ncbi:MAG: DUF3179 domain-containing protein, partial [Acidobacteria bacterium]
MSDLILASLAVALPALLFLPSSPPVLKFVGSPGYRLTYLTFRSRYVVLAVSVVLFFGLLIRSLIGVADSRWTWMAGIILGLELVYFFFLYQPNLFRPLRETTWLSADEADRRLRPGDEVLGIVVDDDARAIPTEMLNRPHVVTDVVGGTPVAVTYCLLCHSAIAFRAEIDGRRLDLVLAGNYYNNVIFYDRASGNLVQQMNPVIPYGPDRGRRLAWIPVTVTTWARWRREHPSTSVLLVEPRSWFDHLVRRAIASIDARLRRAGTPFYTLKGRLDRRLFATEMVLGVAIGSESKAYPLSLIERHGVINDEVGREPIVIFSDPAGELTDVFSRRLDRRILSFQPAGERGRAIAIDG